MDNRSRVDRGRRGVERLFEEGRAAAAARDGRQRETDCGAAAERSIYTVRSSSFHDTVETTGVVDFDNDQATSVLSPISGPVSRLSVSLGQKVKKGEPLATVDSPDFAAAISAYQKALATAKTDRHLADVDKDLLEHNGSRSEVKRHRPKPTRPTPRRTGTRHGRHSYR